LCSIKYKNQKSQGTAHKVLEDHVDILEMGRGSNLLEHYEYIYILTCKLYILPFLYVNKSLPTNY